MTPRLSVLTAIDTDGNVYNAITGVNTDSDVFRLFLAKLCDKLYAEDAQYKQHVVLHFDGAPYHKTDDVRDYLRMQGVQAIINGPYGYDSVVCELFFSALKSTNLHPTHAKTSKK